MKQTTNLGLNLPEYTDTVDIEKLNENFTLIDEKLPAPSTSSPLSPGTAAPGASTTYARGDHVHPTELVWVNANTSASTLYSLFVEKKKTVGYKDTSRGEIYFLTNATSEMITEATDNGTRAGYESSATFIGGEKRIACYTNTITKTNTWTFSNVSSYQKSITATGILKADNVIFVRVFNGAWAAVSVFDASGVSF